jgi:alcohol dehydrogenase class IV
MQFEFSTSNRIIFGSGKLNTLRDLIREPNPRILVITGGQPHLSSRVSDILETSHHHYSVLRIMNEPDITTIRQALKDTRQTSPDLVISIGGGSVIDTAKAIAALLTNPGDVIDYLEVVGHGKQLTKPSVPLIAIPTTAGTGSEVTKNVVLGIPEHGVKVSLRSPFLLPKVALVDPELLLSLPKDVTAFTGLDALTQLIEPYTCNAPNPLTDAICMEGMRHVAHSFRQAYDHGNDLQAREGMALGSLFSGLSLANARLGAVHGLAGVIGGEITAHHGLICARLLPFVMKVNLKTLENDYPGHPARYRYDTIARILCGDPGANASDGLGWINDICSKTNIPPLSDAGLSQNAFTHIIEKSMNSSSMKGNPIPLSGAKLRTILQEAL